ncbi:hypothetical protein ACQEU8_02155 [Streptomyces sp. CA-250714]
MPPQPRPTARAHAEQLDGAEDSLPAAVDDAFYAVVDDFTVRDY